MYYSTEDGLKLKDDKEKMRFERMQEIMVHYYFEEC